MTEYNIHEAAWELVCNQSPASNEKELKYLAEKLVEIAIRENEPIERAWDIKSYWDK